MLVREAKPKTPASHRSCTRKHEGRATLSDADSSCCIPLNTTVLNCILIRGMTCNFYLDYWIICFYLI